MNCPNCGTENPDEAKYCAHCGVAIAPSAEERATYAAPPEYPIDPWSYPAVGAEPLSQGGLYPSTVGELVNRTFGVYQRIFGTAFRIVFLAQIPSLVTPFVPEGTTLVIVMALVSAFTSLLSWAAVTYLVTQQYLDKPTTALQSYIAAMNNGVSLLINALIFAVALFVAIVLSLLAIGLPILVFFWIAWFLFIQAVVIEGKGPFDALLRSWQLVRDSWWRVFGIHVVFLLIVIAAALATAIPGLLVSIFNGIIGNLLLTGSVILVTPIINIAATLLYFDLRVRKEGFTLETLNSEVG